MAALLCAKDLCKTYVIDKRQNNVLKNVKVKSRYGYSVEIERQKSYITSFEAATGMSE